MDMANKAMDWFMSVVNTVIGWGSSFFGSFLPGGEAADERKDKYVKYGLILAGLFFAAQILRLNLNIGGGGSAKGGKGK